MVNNNNNNNNEPPINRQTLRDMAFGAVLGLVVFQYIHHLVLDSVRDDADKAIAAADLRCRSVEPSNTHDHHEH